MRRVIIHYHRDDGDYARWGVWLWPWGYGGRWVPFVQHDDYGKIAICEVPKKHERLGFLIRGESWEKDIDHDRYIEDFIGDRAEVWLISGDPTLYLAPPAHLRTEQRSFPELEVTIHYHRYDHKYAGWNVWLWQEGEGGREVPFCSEDEYGFTARILLECQTDSGALGFVLRKSSMQNAWLQKDGSDRWLPFYRTDDEGRLAIWLLQGDPKIYYRANDVNRTPGMSRAVLEDLNLIRVETYLPVSPDLDEIWGFRLRRRSKKVRIRAVQPLEPCGGSLGQLPGCWPGRFLIKTEEALDLEGRYHLKHKTHGYFPVSFGAVFAGEAFQEKFHYDGDDLGARYTPQATTFKVWSPTARRLEVILYKNGEGGRGSPMPMRRGPRGVWSATLKGDLEGWFYNFLVTHGKKTSEAVDPYAKAAGVNGRRGQIIDLAKTNPPGWEGLDWLPLDNPVDAVIYEVHVRDFSGAPNSGIAAKGRYLGVVEKGTKTARGVATGLDHLKDLGVTHVHLLPIFDFATVDERNPLSGYNWGYDPLNYNVPEGSYASSPYDGRIRIRELKKLIMGLRQAGIGTIMDVVYNHTFHSLSSSLNKLVPGYYYRLHGDGTFSGGSGCGNELADERSMVRKLIVDSAGYWAKEYKLSGFRFDLMGLHHLDTMNAIRAKVDEINPQFLIYGEGWAAGPSTLNEEVRAVKRNTSRLKRVSSFCNDLRDGIKGHVFHNMEAGFIQGAGQEETVKFGMVGAVQHPQINYGRVLYSRGPWAVEPSQCVAYAEAHDNLTLWDKLLVTTPPNAEKERIAMIKLVHAILLTCQGIPFLHAGQDFARTKGGDPNSYQSPDRINQLDWERKGKYLEVYEYTKALIQFRKERPALRMRRGSEVRTKLRFLEMPGGNMLGLALGPHANNDPIETILAFFNSNGRAVQVGIPPGSWDVLVNHRAAGGSLGTVSGSCVWVQARSALLLGGRGGA